MSVVDDIINGLPEDILLHILSFLPTISSKTFEALSVSDDLLTKLPTFHNLIRLEVSSMLSCSAHRTLLALLRIAPNLESLVFVEGFKQCVSNEDDGWALNLMAPCLLLHLKSVEFLEFNGHPRELNAVKLFLKNARVLQRMTIVSSSVLSTLELRIKVLKELLRFPRGSTDCVVEFS